MRFRRFATTVVAAVVGVMVLSTSPALACDSPYLSFPGRAKAGGAAGSKVAVEACPTCQVEPWIEVRWNGPTGPVLGHSAGVDVARIDVTIPRDATVGPHTVWAVARDGDGMPVRGTTSAPFQVTAPWSPTSDPAVDDTSPQPQPQATTATSSSPAPTGSAPAATSPALEAGVTGSPADAAGAEPTAPAGAAPADQPSAGAAPAVAQARQAGAAATPKTTVSGEPAPSPAPAESPAVDEPGPAEELAVSPRAATDDIVSGYESGASARDRDGQAGGTTPSGGNPLAWAMAVIAMVAIGAGATAAPLVRRQRATARSR